MEDDDFFLPDTCSGIPAYRNMHSHRNSPTRSRTRSSTSTRISSSSSRRRTTASVSATLSQTDSASPHPPGLRRQSANAHDFFTGSATPNSTARHISNLTGVSTSRIFTAGYSLGPTPSSQRSSSSNNYNIPHGCPDVRSSPTSSPTSSFSSSTISSDEETQNMDTTRRPFRERERPFGGPPPVPSKETVEGWIAKYGYSNGL